MTTVREPVWVSLPVEDGERLPNLDHRDSYLVRLQCGSVLWAVFVRDHGAHFERELDGEATGEVLDNLEAVMVAGYGPGVAARIIAAADKAQAVLGPKYLDREPVTSSERDNRLTGSR